MAITTQINAFNGVIPPSSADPENFDARADATVAALPALQTQINNVSNEMNLTADAVTASEVAAAASLAASEVVLAETELARDIAVGAANYQGDWSSATTYQQGQSVSYMGKTYVAKRTTVADQPDISPLDWLEVELGRFPIGAFAYWDKDAVAPDGHVVFNTQVALDAAQYPALLSIIPIDSLVLRASIANPQPAASDFFGDSVAISGDYAIVGATQDDPGGVSAAGSAYIYFRNGTTWSLQATLPNPEPAASDVFGNSVAISGDYAIVGASGDDPGGVSAAGSAYIYFRTGTSWNLQATLTNPAPANNGVFGASVSISGEYAIVGAIGNPTGGSAYIYFRSGTAWSLQATLPNPEPTASDFFGDSVAISGDYAIVGATQDDPGGVSAAGSAYIYFRNGTTWSLQATLPNPEPAASDFFGNSVAISGDYAIVGASGDDPGGVSAAGSAYIYFRTGTSWNLQATLTNPAPANNGVFGASVSISGEYAIVGAIGNPTGGSAYIYFRSGTAWSLQATLPNPEPTASDLFGDSVAISGDYAIVGAIQDDPGGVSNAGSAYIYQNNANVILLNPLPASAEHKTIVRIE